MTKPVFAVSDQVKLKQVYSATETSEILHESSLTTLFYI